jgi:hypothetical protein
MIIINPNSNRETLNIMYLDVNIDSILSKQKPYNYRERNQIIDKNTDTQIHTTQEFNIDYSQIENFKKLEGNKIDISELNKNL